MTTTTGRRKTRKTSENRHNVRYTGSLECLSSSLDFSVSLPSAISSHHTTHDGGNVHRWFYREFVRTNFVAVHGNGARGIFSRIFYRSKKSPLTICYNSIIDKNQEILGHILLPSRSLNELSSFLRAPFLWIHSRHLPRPIPPMHFAKGPSQKLRLRHFSHLLPIIVSTIGWFCNSMHIMSYS